MDAKPVVDIVDTTASLALDTRGVALLAVGNAGDYTARVRFQDFRVQATGQPLLVFTSPRFPILPAGGWTVGVTALGAVPAKYDCFIDGTPVSAPHDDPGRFEIWSGVISSGWHRIKVVATGDTNSSGGLAIDDEIPVFVDDSGPADGNWMFMSHGDSSRRIVMMLYGGEELDGAVTTKAWDSATLTEVSAANRLHAMGYDVAVLVREQQYGIGYGQFVQTAGEWARARYGAVSFVGHSAGAEILAKFLERQTAALTERHVLLSYPGLLGVDATEEYGEYLMMSGVTDWRRLTNEEPPTYNFRQNAWAFFRKSAQSTDPATASIPDDATGVGLHGEKRFWHQLPTSHDVWSAWAEVVRRVDAWLRGTDVPAGVLGSAN